VSSCVLCNSAGSITAQELQDTWSQLLLVMSKNCFFSLGVELTVAQGLMKRMQNEGFLRQAAKGKRYGFVVFHAYTALMFKSVSFYLVLFILICLF
jgi:hypothetical protein